MADRTVQKELMAAYELVLGGIGKRLFDEQTEVERVLTALWALEGDVSNGGFDQYFHNSSGDLAFFAPTALTLVGAPVMAGIVSRANALFGSSGPARDWNERRKQLRRLPCSAEKVLDQLTDEFDEYPEDLSTLTHRYVELCAPDVLARVRS